MMRVCIYYAISSNQQLQKSHFLSLQEAKPQHCSSKASFTHTVHRLESHTLLMNGDITQVFELTVVTKKKNHQIK